MLLSCQHARTRTLGNPVSLNSPGTAVPGLRRLAAATFLKTAIPVRPRPAIDSCTGLTKLDVELDPWPRCGASRGTSRALGESVIRYDEAANVGRPLAARTGRTWLA